MRTQETIKQNIIHSRFYRVCAFISGVMLMLSLNSSESTALLRAQLNQLFLHMISGGAVSEQELDEAIIAYIRSIAADGLDLAIVTPEVGRLEINGETSESWEVQEVAEQIRVSDEFSLDLGKTNAYGPIELRLGDYTVLSSNTTPLVEINSSTEYNIEISSRYSAANEQDTDNIGLAEFMLRIDLYPKNLIRSL